MNKLYLNCEMVYNDNRIFKFINYEEAINYIKSN